MFNIRFFQDKSGNEPVREWLDALDKKADKAKEDRVLLKKVREYTKILGEVGTAVGRPVCRHIDGDLWELKPHNNRVFFFCLNGKSIILLHQYVKKTPKAPRSEIERAKKNMRYAIERSEDYE